MSNRKLENEIHYLKELLKTEKNGLVKIETFRAMRMVERLRILKLFQWISITDNQPDDNHIVLVLLENAEIVNCQTGEKIFITYTKDGIWVNGETGKKVLVVIENCGEWENSVTGEKILVLIDKDGNRVNCEGEKIFVALYSNGNWIHCETEEKLLGVTHWMEMRNPPYLQDTDLSVHDWNQLKYLLHHRKLTMLEDCEAETLLMDESFAE